MKPTLAIIAMLAEPGHRLPEIGMLTEQIIDFEREIMAVNGGGGRMRKKPGEIK